MTTRLIAKLNCRSSFVTAALALCLAATPNFARPRVSSEARYTIVLLKYDGPSHVKNAKKDVEALKRATGLTDMYIINEDLISTVYYGKYAAIESREDRDEAERFKRDLNKLLSVTYKDSRPFQGAFGMPMPEADPAARPEWNLKNAKGAYSLQVGAYKDAPSRKEAAVEAVAKARAMGLEAYYFHGPTTSSVCLGAFPAEAMHEVKPDVRARADQELIIVPFLPKGMPDEIKQADGTNAKIVEHRFEVTDPQLMALMRKYPNHDVNGEEARLPNGERAQSFIVDISEVRRTSLLNPDGGAGRPDPAAANAAQQIAPRPSTPGSGKLKSIQ